MRTPAEALSWTCYRATADLTKAGVEDLKGRRGGMMLVNQDIRQGLHGEHDLVIHQMPVYLMVGAPVYEAALAGPEGVRVFRRGQGDVAVFIEHVVPGG